MRETLHVWDDELCRALEGKADEMTLSILLSIMLDGFPQAKTPGIDIYVDGVLLLISGEQVSPQIVAAAISRVGRKNRFPPSIAELLDECSEMTKAAREGFQVEVKGKLANLIGGRAFPQAKYSGGRVVAEEGLEPPTRGL